MTSAKRSPSRGRRADAESAEPAESNPSSPARSRRVKISLASVAALVGIATGVLTLRDQLFGPGGTQADRGSSRAALAPASIPPVVDECSVPLSIGANGNAGPLLCEGGKLNTRAWEYFAKNSPLVMALGPNVIPDQVLRAMCSDLQAEPPQGSTIPIELSAYQLAATYYGWDFGVDPRQEFVEGNC